MEAYQSGSAWHFKVYNPEVSVDTANIFRISGPPKDAPSSLTSFLNSRGRDWTTVVFAEETTGVVRFTETKENPTGHFATNLWFFTECGCQEDFRAFWQLCGI